MKLDSIRTRMTAGLTLFVALLSLVGGFGLWFEARRDAYERDQLRLQTTVTQVRSELEKGKSWEEIAQTIRDQSLRGHGGEVEFWRVSANGHEVGHAFNPPGLPPELRRDGLGAEGAREGQGRRGGGAQRRGLGGGGPRHFPPDDLVPPLADPNGWITARLPQGNEALIIAVPWHRTRHALDNQALALLLLCAFTTVVTGMGAWVLVGRTLSPIEKLAAQARQQAQSQKGEAEIIMLRSPSSDKEMRELVATFNALLDNVARTARVREQFHTSASHELRTPLQALSGTLQLALSRPRSNEEYQAALRDARAQSERLNALTRDLLVLNELGTANSMTGREAVSIAEACDLALSGLERPIAAKNVQLEESLQPTEVYASPSHVEMLTRNLLENAVKYSPQGGTVRVQTGDAEPRLHIWNMVESAVPQVGEQNLNEWFEPFYRPDVARASNTGGNGLGLAICKAICDANDWKIEIKNHQGVEALVWFVQAPQK